MGYRKEGIPTNTQKKQVDFFMGCNAPDGFYSLYDELRRPVQGIRRYLIKGGAGTGKSTLMRRAAGVFAERDPLMERIHCSSDPDSLDGVIFHGGRVSIVDATPPHTIEPAYPGGFESVVNLLDFFDEEKLESRLPQTVALQTANGECHRKCRGMLKCAEILLQDNARCVEQYTSFQKLSGLTARLCKSEFKPLGRPGTEYRRLLSAVTNQGILTYENTISTLCNRVIVLQDDYGVSAPAILARIRENALEKGHTLFSCWCPLAPQTRLSHLLFPELSLGFVTRSRFCALGDLKPRKVIHYTRFTDMDALHRQKQYLKFNRKAAAELLEAAAAYLRQAKQIHDQLEAQYTDAVDFTGVAKKTERLLAALEKRYTKAQG